MSELADHEHITRPSATGIVGRLAERGLIARHQAASDGRSTVIGLTPEGSMLVVHTGRERTAFLTEALAKLDDADLDTLDDAIEIFGRMLDRNQ
jgi:DNA-binding MarR family transcriptional regulator